MANRDASPDASASISGVHPPRGVMQLSVLATGKRTENTFVGNRDADFFDLEIQSFVELALNGILGKDLSDRTRKPVHSHVERTSTSQKMTSGPK
jgi:hypothetical protein